MSNKELPTHNIDGVFFEIYRLNTLKDYDSSKPHRHNYFEIFLFEKGGGHHLIDFNSTEILDKTIHFVSPEQVHHVKRALNSKGYIILFNREFFYLNAQNKTKLYDFPFFHVNGASDNLTLNTNDHDFSYLLGFVKQMFNEYSGAKNFHQEVIQSYLNIFVFSCKRFYEDSYDAFKSDSQYNDFRVLLENNFKANHEVIFYADKLNITSKKLTQIIKANSGKTAIELIHQRLILEAKQLLKHSESPVKEICFSLNFNDPSYFNKFFKKFTGLTPKEYRLI